MKVMFVIPHVSGGGGEKVLSDLAAKLGGEVVLVVFEKKFSYPFQGRVISLDIPIRRTSIGVRISGFIRRSNRFRRVLQDERPDAVISFMGEANFITALLAPNPIVTVHNHLSSMSKMRGGFERAAFSLLTRLLYRRAKVVAVSEAVKSDLVEEFGVPAGRISVIPNAVDSAKIQQLASEEAACPWNPRVPVVVTTGRMCLEKGQWHLLRAFAEVRRKRPCQLAILGTGELKDYLERLAKELAVEKDVFFLGWQSNPFKFMARADLFVLPSLTEGFGLALVEAMACRLPVIATDCPGGSREIILPAGGSGCGILVPGLDHNMSRGFDPLTPAELKLAEAMSEMLQDSAKRDQYVRAGLSRVRDFGAEQFVKKYQRLLA